MYDLNNYKLISKVSFDYYAHRYSNDYDLKNKVLAESVINPERVVSGDFERGYNNSFYIVKSDDSKILFLGDTVKARIACLNLEKWKDDIKQYQKININKPIFRDLNYHTNPDNVTKIFLFQDEVHVANVASSLVDKTKSVVAKMTYGEFNIDILYQLNYDLNPNSSGALDPFKGNLHYKNAITSIDYNSQTKTLLVALEGINIILSYSLNIGKSEIFLDGETITSYTSGYTYDYFFRFGINMEEQNKIQVRAVKYDNSTKRVYCAACIDESLIGASTPKIKHFIGYTNILNDVKAVVQVLSSPSTPFILINNICQLKVDTIEENGVKYQEYIVDSKSTGHLFSQYYWKNTKYDHEKFFLPVFPRSVGVIQYSDNDIYITVLKT
jgi:hypothetical protein